MGRHQTQNLQKLGSAGFGATGTTAGTDPQANTLPRRNGLVVLAGKKPGHRPRMLGDEPIRNLEMHP